MIIFFHWIKSYELGSIRDFVGGEELIYGLYFMLSCFMVDILWFVLYDLCFHYSMNFYIFEIWHELVMIQV